MQSPNYIENGVEHLEKLTKLLESSDKASVELAFQLLRGMGLSSDERLHKLLTNTGNKIAFCLKYGFVDAIKGLERLYIHQEIFTKLPAEIGELRNLEELELRQNQLGELPRQIAF